MREKVYFPSDPELFGYFKTMLPSTILFSLPVIPPNSTWSVCGITFANQISIGSRPRGIFIDHRDTVYIADHTHRRVLAWSEKNNNHHQISTRELFDRTALFVTVNGDIYVENGDQEGRIEKWRIGATSGEPVETFPGNCFGLFIDIRNHLYCSIREKHQVVKIMLDSNNKSFAVVAGTRNSSGSGSDKLNRPCGVFVDVYFSLYVADSGNNRIQVFLSGESNGITVAGGGVPNGLELQYPSGVILDASNMLYVADNQHHRVVRVGSNSFRCLFGCTEKSGSASSQLYYSYSVGFDSHGHLYVADEWNDRIQKFNIDIDSCDCMDHLEIQTSTNAVLTTEQTTMQSWSTENPSSSTPSVSLQGLVSHAKLKFRQQPQAPQPSQIYFVPTSCSNGTNIGMTCNTPGTLCDLWSPCRNNGTCVNNDDNNDYNCTCLPHFDGKQCETDNRPCKKNTCLNGICNQTSNCTCAAGWEGTRCERRIDYCVNATCYNNAVCRSLLGNYTCECLSDSYSGRHCEIVAKKFIVYQSVCKSFAYIAIIAMASVVLFVIVMDALKYCFGSDLTRSELERIRREKRAKKRKPVIQRFTYVNAIPSSGQTISKRKETAV
ncbi:unnamed protein product [Adineta ricciae]|uniref:EGF-like domain-containing protein n=1 Tax=Adineta ricciae TaxID=249248 RepID=A0A816DU16_ADIRI|nr:unnamed protein product [Adineta ricciae]